MAVTRSVMPRRFRRTARQAWHRAQPSCATFRILRAACRWVPFTVSTPARLRPRLPGAHVGSSATKAAVIALARVAIALEADGVATALAEATALAAVAIASAEPIASAAEAAIASATAGR